MTKFYFEGAEWNSEGGELPFMAFQNLGPAQRGEFASDPDSADEGIVIEPTTEHRPDDADSGTAVIGDVTPVALRGNAPLKHYRRAELPREFCSIGGHGFLYALVFPGKTNGMTIGIGTSSSYDLNRQHQPLDVIHYNDVMAVAAEIERGDYRMADGPLTQRFFGDERAYKERIGNGGSASRPHQTFTKTDLTLYAPALASVMQRLHRDVWGDPLDEATRIKLDADRTLLDLVVRYDSFLDRVLIGVTPKASAWDAPKTRGGKRTLRADSAGGSTWEFAELLRFNARTLKHAIVRWDEARAVNLPINGGYQLSGDALDQTLSAMRVEGELLGWPVRL